MRSTKQLSITLPVEMAELVKAMGAADEYGTESDVIREGLGSLFARDRTLENFLQEEAGPAYDALKADRSRALSPDQVRATLVAEHVKAAANR